MGYIYVYHILNILRVFWGKVFKKEYTLTYFSKIFIIFTLHNKCPSKYLRSKNIHVLHENMIIKQFYSNFLKYSIKQTVHG